VIPARQQEDALGKVYDGELIRRLWPFLRPELPWITAALALAPLRLVVLLLPPLLFGAGIARMLGQEPSPQIARFLPVLDALPGFSPFAWTVLLMLAATLIGGVLEFARQFAMTLLGQRALLSLRQRLFEHVQRLPLRFFDHYPVGRLVTRLTNDAETLGEMFTGGVLALVTDLAILLAIAAVLFAIQPVLALAAMLVVPVLTVVAAIFRWKVREAFREVRVRIARINAHLQETISGIKIVQLFARERRNYADFQALNRDHRDSWIKSIRYDALLTSSIDFAVSLATALIFWRGAALLGAGEIRIDVLFVFVEYMRHFFAPLQDLSARYSVMQSSMASLERIVELLDVAEEPRDAAGPAGWQMRGEVVFDRVSFGYDGELVVRDVSLRVAPGERIAIVGHTGSGKTTLLKLLARLYDVREGAIRLDGVDIRELSREQLRGRMAFVLQDVFMFSGDLAYNVALGRPGIGEAEIAAAARSAHADRLAARMPEGFAQQVRERGVNFSAGERQLLAFARALARGPELLLLDEATANVDAETEGDIQDAVHELLRGKTCIVVAHRLSTIQNVDRIYVMHHGELHESGTHDELLARRGLYWRLYQLQYAPAESAA
jgi:ATP-binding cassette, subfamily B, multidrug efflux pump